MLDVGLSVLAFGISIASVVLVSGIPLIPGFSMRNR